MGLLSAVVNGLLFGGVLAVLSLGLNLMFGVMQIIHLSYGQLVMVGLYLLYVFVVLFGFPYYVAVILTLIVTGLLGVLFYYLIVNPLLDAPLLNQLLALACTWIILENSMYAIFGASYYSLPFTARSISVGDFFISYPNLVGFIGGLGILSIIYLFLNKTYIGRAIKATADNVTEASLMGINPKTMYIIVLVMGTALTGITASFFGQTYATHPYFGGPWTLIAFVIVALGGLGNPTGGVIAAFIIGTARITFGYLWGSELATILVLLVFVVIIVFRPQGLLGVKA